MVHPDWQLKMAECVEDLLNLQEGQDKVCDVSHNRSQNYMIFGVSDFPQGQKGSLYFLLFTIFVIYDMFTLNKMLSI